MQMAALVHRRILTTKQLNKFSYIAKRAELEPSQPF